MTRLDVYDRAGFEGVYQSSAVVPHWHVTADDSGLWDVRIQLGFHSCRPAAGGQTKRNASLAEV